MDAEPNHVGNVQEDQAAVEIDTQGSPLLRHLWRVVLAGAIYEFSAHREQIYLQFDANLDVEISRAPSPVFLLVQSLEALPRRLRMKIMPRRALSDEAILAWHKQTFTAKAAVKHANEWRYNFLQMDIPATLLRHHYRPSALRLEDVKCLAAAVIYSKNTDLEAFVQSLQDVVKLGLLDSESCIKLFHLVAKRSSSSPEMVDRYNPQTAKNALLKACSLRKTSSDQLENFLSDHDFCLSPLSKENSPDAVDSLGEAYLLSLNESEDFRYLARNVTRLYHCEYLEEEFCVELLNILRPFVGTNELQRKLAKLLVQVARLRVMNDPSTIREVLHRARQRHDLNLSWFQEKIEVLLGKTPGIRNSYQRLVSVDFIETVRDCGEHLQVLSGRASIDSVQGRINCRATVLHLPNLSNTDAKRLVDWSGSGKEYTFLANFHVARNVRGHGFLVFEDCLVSLEMFMEDSCRLSHEQKQELVRSAFGEMLEAVFILHKREIVHGCIRLSSFSVSSNGHIKLLNAPCGFYRDPNYIEGNTSSPEEADDYWGLGLCLFKLLTGELPQGCGSITEEVEQILDRDARVVLSQWLLHPNRSLRTFDQIKSELSRAKYVRDAKQMRLVEFECVTSHRFTFDHASPPLFTVKLEESLYD